MGILIDTVATAATNPGAGGAATVAAGGDSLSVRAAPTGSNVWLDEIIRGGATAGFAGVRSPLLHDPTRGIRLFLADSPARYALSREVRQRLYPGDNLITEVSGGAAEVDVVALCLYYENFPGISARLASAGDLVNNVRNVKPVQVNVAATGAAGTWVDTVITTTESLLQARQDYAVLGYIVDSATAVVGVKAVETGNLRVCAWGSTDPSDTADIFVEKSNQLHCPYIPVINADNAKSAFVSTFDNLATHAVNVTLMLAELINPFAVPAGGVI